MKKIFFLLFISLFILSGCSVEYENDQIDVSYNTEDIFTVDYPNWTNISEGLDLKQFIINEQNIITVLKIDNNNFNWAVAQDTQEPKQVSLWQNDLNADLVFNGGYFDENNQATGLLIINQEQFGKLSTDGSNGYTGMLLIKDGQPELRYLPEESFDQSENIDYGLQTFPTLIWNGKNVLTKDTGQTARRTVLASSDNNKMYLIISESMISLYQLADWLENSDFNLFIAINLDGGTSTGLAVNSNGFLYQSDSAPVPQVIYVEKVISNL